MKTKPLYLIAVVLIASISMINAQNTTKTIKGEYLGTNDSYNYVFELEDGSKMEFHEIDYELEHMLNEDNLLKKFKVTYEEEVITDTEEIIEEYNEEIEEEDSKSINSSFIYRKIIDLKLI